MSNSKPLGRLDFAGLRKRVTVDVPELEGSVNLRALSVGQLTALKGDDPNNLARQLALAIVDEDGKRIYADDEQDIENLNQMSVTAFRTLIDALSAGLRLIA